MKDTHFLSESDFFAMRRQRNIAFAFNIAQLILAVFLVYAIISVARWARPEPFLLKKDDVTGQIEVYQPYTYKTATIPEDELYKESMAAQYVKRREQYYWYSFEDDQRYINTYTEGKALASYKQKIDPDRKGSLPYLLKNIGYAKVKINTVQKIESELYQVRWQVLISDNGVNITRKKPLKFISMLKFRIGVTHPQLSKRLINPYGVTIYEYRTNQED